MRPLTRVPSGPPPADSTTALLRAIGATFGTFGFDRLAFEEVVSRSWASATFAGARHKLCLRLDGEGAGAAADAFVAGLAAAEFELRGHILADIALVSDERLVGTSGEPLVRLRIEALTVEDC